MCAMEKETLSIYYPQHGRANLLSEYQSNAWSLRFLIHRILGYPLNSFLFIQSTNKETIDYKHMQRFAMLKYSNDAAEDPYRAYMLYLLLLGAFWKADQ